MPRGRIQNQDRVKPCRNILCPIAYPPPHEQHRGRYPRIVQRGLWRKWLMHHWTIWKLSGLTPEDLKAQGLEVHHLDFNSRNPCPYNLLILPRALHLSFRNRTNLGNRGIDSLVANMILGDMARRRAYASLPLAALSEIKRKEP